MPTAEDKTKVVVATQGVYDDAHVIGVFASFEIAQKTLDPDANWTPLFGPKVASNSLYNNREDNDSIELEEFDLNFDYRN